MSVVAPPEPRASALQLFASVSRLHIIAIAALGTLTFGWLFTGRYFFVLSGLCALDWYIVNILNRVVDLAEDKQNAIVGTGFVERHRKGILGLGFSLLALSFALTYWLAPAITPYRLGYHALGLTYNWRLLPGRRRVKDLYFFKNTASAVGFLLTVFCYPLAHAFGDIGLTALAPGISAASIALAGGFFFLFELSYEVLYDLRDIEGDAREGVKTYPVVHGEATAIKIVDGLLLASAAFLIGGYIAGPIPWRLFVMVAAPALQLALYKRWIKTGLSSGHCIALTWIGAGLLAVYHLWIVLGLPGVSA